MSDRRKNRTHRAHPGAILPVLAGLSASALAQTCGTPWQLFIGPVPFRRTDYAAAYDAARGQVVLFGGRDQFGPLWGTNLWTATGPGGGGSWSASFANGAPGRYRHGMAYDAARQRVLMFGGYILVNNVAVLTNQTWEWDGSSWAQRFPATSPPAMEARPIAYDAARQRVVLVSTAPAGSGDRVTWEFDGANWTSAAIPTPPAWSPREFSMANDLSRSRMVLTGQVFESFDQTCGTWERDSQGWALIESGTLPRPTSGHRRVYVPARGRVLSLRESTFYDGRTTAWEWTGSQWRVLSSGGPPAMYDRWAVHDQAGAQVLLFGGQVPKGATTDSLWLYRPGVADGPVLSDVGVREEFAYVHTGPHVFRVTATGSGTISYQWRLNGVELFDGEVFSGSTTPQLSVQIVDSALTGYYDAVVTDACGSTIRPATRLWIGCYPNCDGSSGTPVLTAEDFQCYINKYAAGDPYANCDGSTALPRQTANDFMCFINRWASGCN